MKRRAKRRRERIVKRKRKRRKRKILSFGCFWRMICRRTSFRFGKPSSRRRRRKRKRRRRAVKRGLN